MSSATINLGAAGFRMSLHVALMYDATLLFIDCSDVCRLIQFMRWAKA